MLKKIDKIVIVGCVLTFIPLIVCAHFYVMSLQAKAPNTLKSGKPSCSYSVRVGNGSYSTEYDTNAVDFSVHNVAVTFSTPQGEVITSNQYVVKQTCK